MSNSKDTSTQAMVRHWRRVGPLLEEVRRRELQALDPQEGDPMIDELLKLTDEMPTPARTTSGLVEQQRRFQALRLRNRRQ